MYYAPPQFFPVNLQHSSCMLIFSIRMGNNVGSDQMASSEASCSVATVFSKRINLGSAGQSLIFVLFDLILYVPSTIFQLNKDGSSWVEPVLS